MTTWTDDELERIGDAQELELSSLRSDGSLRPYVTMWVVRSGDELYVRSAYGPNSGWYRRARPVGAAASAPAVSSATSTSRRPPPMLTTASMRPTTTSTTGTAPPSWAASLAPMPTG